MPRVLKLGGTEVVVKTLEIDGNRLEELTLDELLRQGGSESDVPAAINNLTSKNLSLPDEPNNSMLFSNGGRITGSPSIIHDQVSKNTSFFGKINVVGNLNVDKQEGDTDVGVVVDNTQSNVGITVNDNDILSISYVNKNTKKPLNNRNLPVKIYGSLETTSNLKIGSNLIAADTTNERLNLGNTLNIDGVNKVTSIVGDVNLNKLNFSENELYITTTSIQSEYSSNIITINVNNAMFGRTVVTGTLGPGDTINGFIIQNQPENSRVNGILNIDQDNITLSGTLSNVNTEKNAMSTSLTNGDKILFTIENFNGQNFFSFKLFSQ